MTGSLNEAELRGQNWQNWTLEKLTDWLMTNGEGEGEDRRAEERGRESHKSQMTQRKTARS